jgi:hypothetical protein
VRQDLSRSEKETRFSSVETDMMHPAFRPFSTNRIIGTITCEVIRRTIRNEGTWGQANERDTNQNVPSANRREASTS